MRRDDHKPGAVLLGSDFKALGVARSLGRRGIPSVVVDCAPRSAWYSRYVTKRFRWTEKLDDPLFVPYLLRLAQTEGLERWILIPMHDEVVELVARHTERLAAVFQLVTQDWSVLRWACDKRLTYVMAAQVGVPAPRTWYPKSFDELDTMTFEYPVIIKPAISVHLQYALRVKALPARTLDELRCQYQRAARILSADEIMVQEIIPGSGSHQCSIAIYCKDGESVASMTARRIRQYPRDYGLGSSFVRAVEMPELFEPAQRVLRFMRLSGMVEIEFKLDPRDGQYKLLDINARPWGWHSLCTACGLDFPYIQYCGLLGQLEELPAPRYDRQWVRLLADLPAAFQEVRAGTLTPLGYVRSLFGRTTCSVLDWRDPLPAVGDVYSMLSRTMLSHIMLSRTSKGTDGGATVGRCNQRPIQQ